MMISKDLVAIRLELAMKNPRNLEKIQENVISCCTVCKEMAESCIYTLERRLSKSKPIYNENGEVNRFVKEEKIYIMGASIRLAEILAREYGNIDIQSYVKSNDGKIATAVATFWDIEKNYTDSTEVHQRVLSLSDDMRINASNSAKAKAKRNVLLPNIDTKLLNKAIEACLRVVVGDTSSKKKFESKKQEALEKLKSIYGIEQQRILSFFNKNTIKDLTSDELAIICGVGTSIKDGLISAEMAFIHGSQEKEIETKKESNVAFLENVNVKKEV